jgi:hypothetical protein
LICNVPSSWDLDAQSMCRRSQRRTGGVPIAGCRPARAATTVGEHQSPSQGRRGEKSSGAGEAALSRTPSSFLDKGLQL